MSYTRHEYEDGIVVTDPNGNEIYRRSGDGYIRHEIAEAVLDDANFGEPQKSALKAAFGVMESEDMDGPMP